MGTHFIYCELDTKFLNIWKKNSSVCIVDGLWPGRTGFDYRQGKDIFLYSTTSETCSGVHPASYPMGTGSSVFGGKVAGT
jgi:hypothetical protein